MPAYKWLGIPGLRLDLSNQSCEFSFVIEDFRGSLGCSEKLSSHSGVSGP